MFAAHSLPTGRKYQPSHFVHFTEKLTVSEVTALPEDNEHD